MLLADREELWPRLEKLGEKKVREMLAANEFETHEEEEVQEWLIRQASVGAAQQPLPADIGANAPPRLSSAVGRKKIWILHLLPHLLKQAFWLRYRSGRNLLGVEFVLCSLLLSVTAM